MNSNEWFASWFDTSYYHLLYQDRDFCEAQQFVMNLVENLAMPANALTLDLACGKGRHSLTLNEKGMNVLGVDLSEKSIEEAKLLERENLQFRVHDMRFPIDSMKFDYIFNLFTSFGYFENDLANLDVLRVIHGMLRFNGKFVFDFLNLKYTLDNLVPSEEKTISGVHFIIERKFDGKFIKKSIDIDDQGKLFHYEEKVRGYSFTELSDLLVKAEFEIEQTFGDFSLEAFNEESSDRAIFICKRKDKL